ncbi:nucleoside triphosphate hydrolase [Corynebacterium sp. P5848]|uniref:MazG nucleotide pyrophosphohydrolase domain-containing protein n=1 Tax=Corynebacterium marambiense TaxID=2765364 RepID=UPI002260A34A|nr:MazG nucleotide pyrophosphohydrolase domain-containing protein [Corynebacterium marambiense]MCX7542186.1 nucleoside triphosphate hydrolase [Corynebacterium marambiense]
MTVLLLDPASPTLIPAEVIITAGTAADTVAFSDSVPESVREIMLGHGLRTRPPVEATVWVDTDPGSPETLRRLAAGESFRGPGASGIAAARAVMARALRIGEWESSQDHVSLLPYLWEETEEFDGAARAHADGTGTATELRGELADVLLQVLFHAEIAARRGDFDFDDVADSFTSKLRRRAPYLFDGTTTMVTTGRQEEIWQAAKNRGG